uniref:Uncharacterized protein n=1 Tax=Caenorhabditis japonica TaxID=281687 RepID=A0A8R1DU12_CAEJA
MIDAPIAEEEEDCEEKFGGAKEFFAKNVISPNDESVDEGQTILSRLSTSSEAKISTGASSVGRKNSIFRKMFPGKHETKERRLSEVFPSDYHPADSASENTRGRRASIVSFTNDCSIGVDVSRVNASVSVSSLASNDSMQKPKLRKKTPSTSNLTQRLSSVFRRNSSSAFKDEFSDGNRRNTLNGYSSISSGIGSIASGISDSGYSMTSRNGGQSISRNGSKREDENKRERSQRLLDRIIISDVPAGELLKMKMEILKKRDQKVMNEQFETQLNESDSSTNLPNELLNFDTIAVDVNPNGKPFSSVAATIIDEKIENTVRNEVMFRPDRCGTITDCEPELIFVCQEPTPSIQKNPNDSMCSNLDVNSDLLRNVRSGLCKSIEEWKKLSDSRESSTMLIYPMFCQSEAEWDSKATIDAIFLMLDGILLNARRWRANGKCILAGLTPNNVRLLKEKYDEVKQSVLMTEVPDGPISSVDDLDVQSITSNSTIFGTKI